MSKITPKIEKKCKFFSPFFRASESPGNKGLWLITFCYILITFGCAKFLRKVAQTKIRKNKNPYKSITYEKFHVEH